MEYNFRQIEQNWKKVWKDTDIYKVTNDTSKPKFYILDMFPYPSGAGLHVGHPLGYIASDIYARYKRMKGFNVLHPMGYDAFGLPAEQYALETGQHPAVTTEKNIARYREQLDNIGFCYDWSREVRTSDPNYYKWTQWIFLQLFHSFYDRNTNKATPISQLIARFETEGNANTPSPEDETLSFTAKDWKAYSEKEKRSILMQYRIAYLSYAEVWWCEALGTVLANDEVVNGVSERGGFPVEKKRMNQWFLRITEYAERLLSSLDNLEWSDAMKEMQRNWIGKSNGAEVTFHVADSDASITVFTTRPDTIFGVDFLVVAPEHELVDTITTADQKEAVEKYKQYVKSRSERERMSEVKQITGAFTGAYAIHPLSKKKVPVWTAEYVLAGYGTGAIMAVPSGDERDHAFAKHFNIDITNIFGDLYNGEEAYSDKKGKIQNSDFLSGLEVPEAIAKGIEALVASGAGKSKVNFRLRDAGFSRQRYWGEPFPIIYVDNVPYAIDEDCVQGVDKALPVELPLVENYKPGPEGKGPLANVTDWVNLTGTVSLNGEGKLDSKTYTDDSLDEDIILEEPDERYSPKYHVKSGKQFELARSNRKQPTEAEDQLWQRLRGNALNVKFRRQHPIEGYIVDFVCLKHALVIEVDSGYHQDEEQRIYDSERTATLKALGFSELRFTNEQVLVSPQTVLDKIREALASPPFPPSPLVEKKDSPDVPPSPLVERGPGGEVLRETNTMPGYAGSSWYFLRYMDPNNDTEFASKEATSYWREVDLYIGGTEHAVGHLLYSRMWTKALYDLGFISFDEPFKKLLNQGMIQGKSFFVDGALYVNDDESVAVYKIKSHHSDFPINIEHKGEMLHRPRGVDGDIRLRNAHRYIDPQGRFTKSMYEKYVAIEENPFVILGNCEVDWDSEKKTETGEPFLSGMVVEKMSKSKYNVDNPDEIVKEFGADTFRMYEMFLGPIDVSKPWDTKGIEGVHRFLKKLWRLYFDEQTGWIVTDEAATEAELKTLHKTIKKIGEDMERFSFNTSVSQFMICVNELSQLNCHKREILEKLPLILCPFAPHLAEELWSKLGNSGSVITATFPIHEEKYVTENSKKYPVAVNGKTRVEMEFPLDAEEADVKKEVLADATIIKWLEGKEPKKFIYIKGRMINVVV